MSDSKKNTGDFETYDTADRFVKRASVAITGRTLRRWCEDNPHLAEGLGRIEAPGKTLFDLTRAPRFREIYVEAERKKDADRARAEIKADRKLKKSEEDR